MIDVREDQLKIIIEILRSHLPEAEVRAFGSRVSWTARDSSDLDLVVIGKTKLDWKTTARLKAAFEASTLPFRVDVLDWHTIPENIRTNIEKQYEVINLEFGVSEAWEQRAIDKIIAKLDEKIELNCRMNETLDSLVRDLCKWWLADFDSVGSKAEGGDSSPPEEIAELFPDEFQNVGCGSAAAIAREKMRVNDNQSKILASIRDALLQKFLSEKFSGQDVGKLLHKQA